LSRHFKSNHGPTLGGALDLKPAADSPNPFGIANQAKASTIAGRSYLVRRKPDAIVMDGDAN
jgi:hypothetical protein